jgi:hypothetical protein
MKKILFIFILLFFIVIKGHATGQVAELLSFDNKSWSMFYCPLDMVEQAEEWHKSNDFEKNCWNTGCWRGYIGHWSIINNKLILTEVVREKSTTDSLNRSRCVYVELPHVFKCYSKYATPQGIFASWVNDTIRIGRGRLIRYNHMAFDRNQEEEAFLIIKKGIVTKVKYFHNRIVQGHSMQDFGKAIIHDSISWNGISDNVHRFLFRMKVNHDMNGHIDSFDLKFYKLTPEQEMIMKPRILELVSRHRNDILVMQILGKYVTETYTFPIVRPKKDWVE